jgi:septum formation protein
MENVREIVLASASPRRKELLEKTGLKFQVEPSPYPETIRAGLSPAELAEGLSVEKARAVADKHPSAIIIAADTIGVLNRKVIGKPGTPEEARQILKKLSGRSHLVVTGFTIMDSSTKKVVTRSVQTRVHIKKLSRTEIANYVSTGEPLDKAGAYAIQGLGAAIVEKIVGDYYNVMGLPVSALVESLKKFGIRVL